MQATMLVKTGCICLFVRVPCLVGSLHQLFGYRTDALVVFDDAGRRKQARLCGIVNSAVESGRE